LIFRFRSPPCCHDFRLPLAAAAITLSPPTLFAAAAADYAYAAFCRCPLPAATTPPYF